MTPEQFKVQMQKIADDPDMDVEVGHQLADEVMCIILQQLGYGEGIAIFKKLHKWYA